MPMNEIGMAMMIGSACVGYIAFLWATKKNYSIKRAAIIIGCIPMTINIIGYILTQLGET